MTGVFTDNQPDFTWLKPFEEKCFHQYFMPYKEVGKVKAASTEAAVGIEIEESSDGYNIAKICVYTTELYECGRILLTNKDGKIYHDNSTLVSPEDIYNIKVGVECSEETDLILTVYDMDGRILVQYDPKPVNAEAIPEPANPVQSPEQVESLEELYLIGLHLEQYRHATYDPDQQENSYYYVAVIESQWGNYKKALHYINLSLIRNSHNIKARGPT